MLLLTIRSLKLFKINKATSVALSIVSAGGLEPPTLCLKGRCSTPELRAQKLEHQI